MGLRSSEDTVTWRQRVSQFYTIRLGSLSPFFVSIFAMYVGISFASPFSHSPVAAQGVQSVLTMESGLQHEGELAGVPEILEGSGVAQIFGNQPIVRVDDGLRQVFVSAKRVFNVGDSNRNEIEIAIHQRVYPGSPGDGSVGYIGPFNEHGHRDLTIVFSNAPPVEYVQGITKITPRWVELKTLAGNKAAGTRTKQWKMKIGTNMVPVDVLRSVMRSRIQDIENPNEYTRIADFFLQSNNFIAADEELRFIQQRFPGIRERLDDDRKMVRQAIARQALDEIRKRLDVGQTKVTTTFAKEFDKDGIAIETLAEFREIEKLVETENKALDETRSLLNDLFAEMGKIADKDQLAAMKTFQQEIEADLSVVNKPRLDAFILAAQNATVPPAQRLSIAISGWLLGSNNAKERLVITQDMFTVRSLIIEYLNCNDKGRRDLIIEKLKEFESGAPQFVDQMLKQILPPSPPDLSKYTSEEPLEFFVEIPNPKVVGGKQSARCLVHLPTEYDPYRKYPLLITLPGGRQTVDQHLTMWCGNYNPKLKVRVGNGMRNGYVVMTVDWRLPGQSAYNYSAREHAVVMKSLREALRKFAVDSDRVFISGHGIGGEAAYDIGLSHPEHWAGVMGVSAKLAKYQDIYYDNEHVQLPFYAVCGSKDLDTIVESKKQWNKWLSPKRYQDATIVWYDGRANELFFEEIPKMFEWMRYQRRRWPDKSGFKFSCKSIRPWDCYFWFLEFDKIPFEDVVWPQAWRNKGISTRMTIEGELKPDAPNVFRIGPQSPKIKNNATLWLSPEFIDMDKVVQIKGRGTKFKESVKASTQTILEDVRRRADRQHPYWAKIECINNKWIYRNNN